MNKRKSRIKIKIERIKLTPYLKGIIKATWVHDDMLYVICINRNITALTEYFSKNYNLPKEKVRVGTLEELIKRIAEHNTRILISIRDGKIIYDPFNFLSSLKLNIKRGLMIGTKEAILRKFILIREYLREIETIKIKVFDNIYSSVVEAAQTALVLRGHPVPIPKNIPKALKKFLPFLGKQIIGYGAEIIEVFKAYEHKKIPLPDGKKLDELNRKAELFREAIKKL